MRYAARKDTTHLPIAAALEAIGKVVIDVSALPDLGMDLIVYDPALRDTTFVEVKSDKKIHHKSAVTRLRPSQVRMAALLPLEVWETVEQALEFYR